MAARFRRFSHREQICGAIPAVKNGMLYIYMGSETYVDSQNNEAANGTITVGYNEYMINVNLSTSWDWKTNIFETASNITANPTTGSVPPQVVNGALYQGTQDDDSIYLYGGTTSYANVSFPGWQGPVAPTYSLWSYDPGSAQWSQFDVSHNAPYRPSNGAAAEAVDQGLAFYYNGELDNGSSEQELGIIAGTNVFLSGMVVINTTDQTARNLSTAQVSGDLARAHARMQYIPGAGEKGVLVLIGGSTFPANQLHSTDIVNLLPMTEINVFDIASIYNASTPDGVWYQQNASNQNATEVPSPRVDFCLIAASSQDSSSYNIYMYGGQDGSNPPNYFDEVWVLSLPSFTWTIIYTGISPRFAHTCHLVGNRTMLTVGGVAAASQMQGLYSEVLPTCDWEIKGVGVYDISELVWGSVYNATAPAYEVPDRVISAIGGNRMGGATMKMPSSNFSQNGLARIFGVDPTDDTEAPSTTVHRKIAIIAGTVCSVVGLAIIIALGGYVAWRWQKPHADPEQTYEKDGRAVEPSELPSNSTSEQPRQHGSA
ncbi:MAG: hypothetical protein ASARMPRED_001726 [Alectoria sarmentosa]|nr:MAG: hypothetical protein ASARMPRED_001726 [Alectoria sarmentosa]